MQLFRKLREDLQPPGRQKDFRAKCLCKVRSLNRRPRKEFGELLNSSYPHDGQFCFYSVPYAIIIHGLNDRGVSLPVASFLPFPSLASASFPFSPHHPFADNTQFLDWPLLTKPPPPKKESFHSPINKCKFGRWKS